jgi:hypothetical protein
VQHDPGKQRRPARLGGGDVGGLFQDDRVAGLGVRLHRDLVGHGRGRQIERRLFAEERRHPVLEGVDRRILLPLFVPDGRLGHEPPHAE